MAVTTATTLYPRNDTTVDTGTGIDVRILSATAGATDSTQSVRFTHTQDGQERTFDPGNTLVTTVADASAFQGEGWALPLTDLTPSDDTNCNAYLQAGTTNVIIEVNCLMSGGTNLGGASTSTFRASLWRYDPTANTGVLIAHGTATQSWNLGVGGDGATFKATTIPITVPATEFSQGEILLLQLGVIGGNLPNATLGTTNFDFSLQLSSVTRVNFTAGQHLTSLCPSTGTTSAAATATGVSGNVLATTGSDTASATVAGAGGARAATVGAATGTASATGVMSSVAGTTGGATGVSTAAATVTGIGSMQGASTGTATVTGALGARGSMQGVSTGSAAASGSLGATGGMTGTAAASAVAAGFMAALSGTTGTSIAAAAVTGVGGAVVGTVGTVNVSTGGGDTIIVTRPLLLIADD